MPGSNPEIWEAIAAPIPSSELSWRIDSKPKARDGKWFARFVVYIEAGTVRNRLDTVVPGEWDLTLEPLPSVDVVGDGGAVDLEQRFHFKARLQVLGVIREDVGSGRDYKNAATDAFKRAAVRFGIGHELYAMEQNWVEVDGDGKFAKPVEDPQAAYDRRYGSGKQNPRPTSSRTTGSQTGGQAPTPTQSSTASRTSSAPQSFDSEAVSCPKCGSNMFDNRLTKRNPRAPDYKCKDRNCDGCIWPARETKNTGMDAEHFTPQPDPRDDDDELPF